MAARNKAATKAKKKSRPAKLVVAPICRHRTTQVKRGLCGTCHSACYYRVKTGKVTDEKLVEDGKWLPVKSAGRPASEYGKELDELIAADAPAA